MLILNADVFEEMIAGTATTWYSYAQFNAAIGSADQLSVGGLVTNISGTVSLFVYTEHSIDGRVWALHPNFSAALFSGATSPMNSLSNGTVFFGQLSDPASFCRLRIYLTGNSPQCRLKLTVAGRSY